MTGEEDPAFLLHETKQSIEGTNTRNAPIFPGTSELRVTIGYYYYWILVVFLFYIINMLMK